MFSSWLFARLAREAIRNDRPDEALRLIEPLLAGGHRKGWQLAREVAVAHVRRAERFLRQDNADAAWIELLAAEKLNTGEPTASALRQTLTRYGLAVVRAALEAGKPPVAVEAAARLRERGVRLPELNPLIEAAQDWVLAAESADRGEFPLAAANIERIGSRLAKPRPGLDQFELEVRQRHERFGQASAGLQEAVDAREWRSAIRWADEALAAAPRHRQTRLLRSKAWDRVHPETQVHVPAEEVPEPALAAVGADGFATASGPSISLSVRNARSMGGGVVPDPDPGTADDEPPLTRLSSGQDILSASRSSSAAPPKRFLLWVNNAGGYLVCLSPRVTLGQGTTDGPVDVPLLADVARLHAELTRDAEGYVLETQKEVTVNGRTVSRTPLRAGDRVTLGPSCQFVFHLPSPVSPTARLEFVSGHHFPLAVNTVILMAETLILGGDDKAHISVPELETAVVLYRGGRGGLGVTFPGPFRVENQPCRDRAPLLIPGWIHGEGFGFGLEPVGRS